MHFLKENFLFSNVNFFSELYLFLWPPLVCQFTRTLQGFDSESDFEEFKKNFVAPPTVRLLALVTKIILTLNSLDV